MAGNAKLWAPISQGAFMQNRTTILAGTVALSLVAAGCSKKADDTTAGATAMSASTPAAATDHTADAATIAAADSAWLRAVMAKNVDSVMVWYTPDAVSYGFGTTPSAGTN
jgi:hypothetical protein